jgi:hypothetical protein
MQGPRPRLRTYLPAARASPVARPGDVGPPLPPPSPLLDSHYRRRVRAIQELCHGIVYNPGGLRIVSTPPLTPSLPLVPSCSTVVDLPTPSAPTAHRYRLRLRLQLRPRMPPSRWVSVDGWRALSGGSDRRKTHDVHPFFSFSFYPSDSLPSAVRFPNGYICTIASILALRISGDRVRCGDVPLRSRALRIQTSSSARDPRRAARA